MLKEKMQAKRKNVTKKMKQKKEKKFEEKSKVGKKENEGTEPQDKTKNLKRRSKHTNEKLTFCDLKFSIWDIFNGFELFIPSTINTITIGALILSLLSTVSLMLIVLTLLIVFIDY